MSKPFSPSNNLSSCHHAETKLVGGVGDFSDHEEGITMHYECTECGEACDLLPVASNNLKEQEHIFKPLAGGTGSVCSCGAEFASTSEQQQHLNWHLSLAIKRNLILDTILASEEMQDETWPTDISTRQLGAKIDRNAFRAALRAMLEGLKNG